VRTPENPTWLTVQQLSDRLQVPVKTLRDWRYHGYGPPGVKFGTARCSPIRYRLSDVEKWERSAELAGAS
jgi:hypothetical protein